MEDEFVEILCKEIDEDTDDIKWVKREISTSDSNYTLLHSAYLHAIKSGEIQKLETKSAKEDKSDSQSTQKRKSKETDMDPLQEKKFKEEQKEKEMKEILKQAREILDSKIEMLSPSQKKHLSNIITKSKSSFFVTGGPGTGKTFMMVWVIMEYIIQSKNIIITATTGTAADVINNTLSTIFESFGLHKDFPRPKATTFHFGTIGRPTNKILSFDDMENFVKGLQPKSESLLSADLLIIDEVSMMAYQDFVNTNLILQKLRSSSALFGGLRLGLFGDFFQFAPPNNPFYIFETNEWKDLKLLWIELEENMRQQSDPEYAKAIQEIRLGEISEETKALFSKKCATVCQVNEKELINVDIENPQMPHTVLFYKNLDCQNLNNRILNQITSEKKVFKISDYKTSFNGKSRIISTTDMEDAKSKITERLKNSGLIQKSFQDKKTVIEELDLELKIGAYVMLIVNINVQLGLVNGATGIVIGWSEKGFPKVKFFNNNSEFVVEPYAYKHAVYTSSGTKKAEIYREVIPLRLSWGITIHKSQGATLTKVLVDLSFALSVEGAALVALSRVRNQKDIEFLKKFDIKSCRANQKVIQLYKNKGQFQNQDFQNFLNGETQRSFQNIITNRSSGLGSIYVNAFAPNPSKIPTLPDFKRKQTFTKSESPHSKPKQQKFTPFSKQPKKDPLIPATRPSSFFKKN